MERIGSDVRRELGRFGPAEGMAGITEAWPGAVGDGIASNAWPARLSRDGTLHVHTKDSIWAFELTQREVTIKRQLGAAAPPAIRFAPGPVPEPSQKSHEQVISAPPEPTRAEQELAAEMAAVIEDEQLRELVSRAVAASLAKAASGRGVW